jgi:hypothetical protein
MKRTGDVMTLDEARCDISVEERRADIIRSAARGQGPTFIAAKLDMLIEQVRAEASASPGWQATYDFKHEATRVCEAIGSNVGNMTVQCALREAYRAGQLDGPAGGAPDAEGERSSERATSESTGLRTRPQSAWERTAKRAQRTLDNIYTMARREARRQQHELRPEMWGHVLRLCEQAGCQPRGVLRDNGGTLPAPPESVR